MKRLTKTFWFLLIAGVIYGGYYYYFREEPKPFAETKKDVFDFLSKTAEKKKQELFESAEQSAKDYAQQKVAGAVFDLGEKIQSLAGSISGDNPALTAVGTPTAIVIKKDMLFSISVHGIAYSVDWGDGKGEKNVSLAGQKLINHSWSDEGDYVVKVEVTEDGAVSTDSFRVRVISQ